MGAAVQIDVLGPLRVRGADGTDCTPDGELQRRLLALLVLRRGTVVPPDAAVDALWPGKAPKDPGAALHTHVFRLRKALPDLIASTDAGYRLDPDLVEVDADRLAGAIDDASLADLDAVLGRWRGPAYPELADLDDGRIEAERLEELRLVAIERRARLRIDAGTAEDVLASLRALAAEHPLRERPRALLVDALAATGRLAEALRAYDDFRRLLADELGIEPSAALTARHAELLSGTAATTTTWTPEHRLPAPATSILGRDELLAEAEALVAGHRLVTLLGLGGVGKTRLLLELGQRLRAAKPERPVVLCELATATEESAVDAVAAALGIEGRPGIGLDETLAQALAEVELVLLLDNCEHVVDGIAGLTERLLARAPAVAMVATSRERLRVAGEQLCPVSPLPFTADDDAAEQLFIERARAVVPGFEPSGDERACVEEIVRRLDGLPLAIELAAARLHTMELQEIAAGLDHRFRLLTTGARTATRHRSLGAAVAWSVGLLDDRLRSAFFDLSVFAGAFTVEDAAAVCDLPVAAAADAVAELTERCLVLRAPGRGHVLLETLRQYGVDEIDSRAHPDAARARHAAHVVARLEALDASLIGDGAETSLVAMDDLLPELRTALQWLLDHGDIDTAGRMMVALEDYSFLRLRPDVAAWAERVTAADPDDRGARAPDVLAVAAAGAWMAGDIEGIGPRIARALDACERRGLPTRPSVLHQLGSHGLYEGRLAEATTWYVQAWEQAPDRRRRWISMGTDVLARSYAGDTTALTLAQQLLAEVGDAPGAHAAFAWYCAGEAELGHDLAWARHHYERAIELGERSGAAFVTGIAATSAASIEARIGEPAVAAAEYRRLIGHWRRAGMWSTQWVMLRWVAVVLEALGRTRESAVLIGAVVGTDEGHRIFGEDEAVITALGERLRAALGDEDYDAALLEGVALDGEATVEHALRSL